MTKTKYNEAREKLGLNQIAMGEILGYQPRQAQRFASGESPIPPAVGKLMVLMLRGKLTLKEVANADT